MKKIKQTADYGIYEKRSGRHAVKGKNKQWLHGDDKVAALTAEGLVKVPAPKPAPVENAEPVAEADASSDIDAAT